MGLIDRAKVDAQRYTTDLEGFGVAITLTSPGPIVLNITGLVTKHHLGIDTDGQLTNTKNSHISFSEQLLIDASYPVRNVNGEVDLYNHQVDVKDSTGVSKKYVIKEWFPDETIGFIVCILGDRK